MQKLYISRDGQLPNAKEWAFIMENLSMPFRNLKFRQQAGSNFAGYADAREYYERFDEVVGPDNWQTEYEPMSLENSRYRDVIPDPDDKDRYGKPKKFKQHTHNDVASGIKCTISIFGVSKSDVGTESMAEAMKGAFSDSFKRAAVQWGPGRYIYTLGYFSSANPKLPEYAQYVEPYPYDDSIEAVVIKIKEKASKLDTERNADSLYQDIAQANIDDIMQNYSEGVSLLQKDRILGYLKQVGKNIGNSVKYGEIGDN